MEKTLLSLENGDTAPTTDDERRFVELTKGQGIAKTALEKAWLKYISLARSKKQFYTLHSASKPANDIVEPSDDYSEDFDVA